MTVKTREKGKYEDLVEESEVLSPDEAKAQIAMLLAKTKNPALLTELSDEEIKCLAVLKSIASKVSIKDSNGLLDVFCDWFMMLRVSLNRKGREEVSRIARDVGDVEEKVKKGLKNWVLGVGK